jgi:hypothetical protein
LDPKHGGEDGCVAWWKMDEGAGSNVLDETVYANDGILKNGSNPWVAGLISNSLSLNGSNALRHITQFLHTGHGLTYDTESGAPAYFKYPTFYLTEYIDKTGGGTLSPPRSGNIVNCYDQAGGVCVLGCLLGIPVEA